MKSDNCVANALFDLRASVSLRPLLIYEKLNMGELKPTNMYLSLAGHSIKYPEGILENVPIRIFWTFWKFLKTDMKRHDNQHTFQTIQRNEYELYVHIEKPMQEKTEEYGQYTFEAAESLKGADKLPKLAVANLNKLSRNGLEELVRKHKLDALVTPYDLRRRYPRITVPAGYDTEGVPFGIFFGGLKGTEPKLIEIAYGFEQATKGRKPPSFKP
ncbi:hypothetical protein P3X46_033566 [Hevea brasiliensis]|uniref:Amidase domain-containing protein n=1 Tax=Hevea brasiliensis TaxID=3981 RepID=A0ABQ9KCT0_HEVBR|nr:hypothetical protein P3X46_033566 [Hevea brasiliensis]